MNTSSQPAASLQRTGMLLMISAMLFLPLLDIIAKYLGQYLSAGQVTASRFVVQTLLLLPFLAFAGRRHLFPRAPRQWLMHGLRGLLLALATMFIFSAVRVMPVADALAIFFVEPLILTLLSAWLLGETFGWRRFVAILVGFAGALLVIQPSFAAFGWVSFMPVGTAVFFSLYMILTRQMRSSEDPYVMQFLTGASGSVLILTGLLIFAPLELPFLAVRWPAPELWGLILLMGAIAAVGHLLIVMASRLTEVSKLAPFQYLEILAATVFGYWVFGDFPTWLTWTGIALIAGSGAYVFHRENVKEQHAAAIIPEQTP